MGIIGVFWMAMPIIEVNEYDLMKRYFRPANEILSLTFHMLVAAVLVLPLLYTAFVDVTTYPVLWPGIAAIAYLALAVFSSNFYKAYLREEV